MFEYVDVMSVLVRFYANGNVYFNSNSMELALLKKWTFKIVIVLKIIYAQQPIDEK